MDLKPIEKLRPFQKFCITIGELPVSYLESMTYLELLYWFINFLQEKVIPAVNNNAEAVEELQTLFTQLHNYVENYFDNLDVQDEINNKLDKMALDGTLESILLNYTSTIKVYQTTDEMIEDVDNLVIGENIKTLGYHSINDCGGGSFIVREKIENETTNNGTIFVFDDFTVQLIYDENINVNQFGAYADGTHDDTTAISNCFANVRAGTTVHFKNDSKYLVSETIEIPRFINVNGNDCHIIISENFINNSYVFTFGHISAKQETDSTTYANLFEIKDFSFHNYTTANVVHGFYLYNGCQITNIFAWGLCTVVKSVLNNYIDKLLVNGVESWGKTGDGYVIESSTSGDANLIQNVHLHYDNVIGQPNTLKFGSAVHGATAKNIINGNILLSGGVVDLNNIHLELGNITITNTMATISNCYIWKQPTSPVFVITEMSSVDLKNIYINYITERFNYEDTNSIDIQYNSTSVVNMKNVFKRMTGENMSQSNHYMGIKASNSDFNKNMVNNSISSSSFNNKTSSEIITRPRNGSYGIFGDTYTLPNIKFKGSSNTYYYQAIMMYDTTRMCGRSTNTNIASKAVTNGGASVALNLNGRANSNYRLYRGTQSGVYDRYVDVAPISNRIIDNDVLVGGNVWNVLDVPAGIDTILNCTNYIDKGDNVEVWATAIPTVGTWQKGDIIINSNPSTGNPYGWVCTSAGTPGTWREISTLTAP